MSQSETDGPEAAGTTGAVSAGGGPSGRQRPERSAQVIDGGSTPTVRSNPRSRPASVKRIVWTPDRLWFALRSDDKKRVAETLGCGLSNVYARVQRFRATSPGGSGLRHVVDRDVHLVMARMLDGARYEVLAAVAFISPSPPPVFDHLLAAAGRGVRVRLLFRADNLAGGLVESLQRGGVNFRTLADLHAKFLITDTTAMNGSANFTQASADRASEVATFFSNPVLVHELREVFDSYWQRARPF